MSTDKALQSFNFLNFRFLLFWVLMAGIGVSVLSGASMSVGTARALLKENGPVEVASAVLHFVVAAAAAGLWFRRGGLAGPIAVAALLLGARELDWHHAFTTFGLFNVRQYIRPEVSLVEKLASAGVIALICTILVVSLTRSKDHIKDLVVRRPPAAYGAVVLLAYLPTLKVLDAIPRWFRQAGSALSETGVKFSRALEEINEMWLPVLVLLFLLQLYHPSPKIEPTPSLNGTPG
ncbi:hypothetical protein PV773_16065 [Mesorhizobium sp. CC13]|uniref:hypothetical protein n=1 Tax=Mesorhizobium sp. CC13 TaxID=3029194 RepID=UPI003267701C